jgi:dihydroflavonol-4-reductase
VRALVTGGNGFIGSVATRMLVDAGHEVVCLLRQRSRVDRLSGIPFRRASGDVRHLASLRRAMAGCDCVVHLAAPGGWADDDPVLLHDVIEDGTRNVLTVASEHSARRVVVVSSTAAIAASDAPRVFDECAEFDVRDPALHYAHAKHRAELIAWDAHEAGLPVIVVNPAEVYGPGDTTLVSAANVIDFATSTPVLVCRGGTSIVHVDDVAAGIVAALERGRPGERYILGGENLTIRELAELVLELTGRRVPIVPVPNGLVRAISRAAVRLRVPLPYNPHVVPYATRYWFVANDKASRELGVHFRGARETIAQTIGWLERAQLIPARSVTRASA